MEQLTIPNQLYGRDQDLATLLETFERIGRGQGEVLLVPGSSGVGKTALVQELRRPVLDRNGFFIRGKFEQYQQNVPYFAFRQALTELCRELQTADPPQRERWKGKILGALGDLGQLLVDLVPEFESFLGAQPPLGDISPQEARHRFTGVFRNFLQVVCQPEQPLILFLDDWQWADAASLELLKQIQVGITLRYLLVIVSYRDNEVDSAHPLMSAVDDLRTQAVPVHVLHVENIRVKDVQLLVADTLQPTAEDTEGLAAFLHGKTLGNPFFVRSFLSLLHDFQLIRWDPARNGWHWRMAAIAQADLPGDVVELFALKLRRLDADSQSLFSLAACLGNRFDLETLSIISGRPLEECLGLLFSAQARTLLLPLDGESTYTEKDRCAPKVGRFLHDRVQQAAYALLEPAELPHLLLKIGRRLLASLAPEQLSERLFEVVNDLNAGFQLIQELPEQVKVVELNLTAARKAYAATAYRAALQFYRAANRFLERPGLAEHLGRDCHELTLQLFQERAKCEFLEGSRAEAENCIHRAVAQARTAIERAEALTILIVQYTLLARYPEAIAAGRQALAALGIRLPEEDYEAARDEELARVRQELGIRPVSSLTTLPVMCDPVMLLASRILITMGPPCYRSHPRLWSVIVPKVVNLTLRYGNIPQVGYSHTAFGGLLGWVANDYGTAREFADLATALMAGTFRSPSDQSVFYLMIGSSIRHWFQHLKQSTQDYSDAVEIGLRSGNLQYAAYAFGHNMVCRFYQGVPLGALTRESQRSLNFSRTRLNQWSIDLLEGGLKIFGVLSGERPGVNGHDAGSDVEYLRQVEQHHNLQVTCIYKVLKTCSLLVLGSYDQALLLSDEAESLIYTVGTQGLLPWPEHVFARLLILTALSAKADEKQQAQWRPELDRLLGKLRIWADNCPENFEHKYWLAAAELARLDNNPVAAMQLYDQAVAAAQTGDFLQWEGLANERAYGFWQARGNSRLAQAYWQQAYVCYDRWGAAAKVRSLEAAYLADLADALPGGAGSGKPAEPLEREIKDALLEKQLTQLRTYALQMQQTRLRMEAVTKAEELAQATERLREQIAERKRVEQSLDATNTALREVVSQREAMLEDLRLHQTELELQNEELRTSQEELDAVRARYFDLYDLAPVGYCTVSEQGLILESNLTAANLLGVAKSVLVKKFLPRFVLPEDQDTYYLYRKRLFETGTPQMCELRLVRQDGTVFWTRLEATVAQDEGGQPVSRVVLSDISERRRVEMELRENEARRREQAALLESEKKYRLVFDSANDAILICDAQARMLAINPVACQRLGYTHAELMSMTIAQIGAPEESQHVPERMSRVLERGQLVFETLHRHKNGSHIPTEVSSRAIIWEGQPALLSICRDITERRQAEEALRESNRQLEAAVVSARELAVQAQAASAAKGRFVANMSHEIRTPLNAVLGFAQLLQRDPKLALDHQPWVATINRSGDHLLALLTQILEFSKLEAEHLDLVSSCFDLPALLCDLQTMFRPQSDARQLTLHLDGLDEVERYLVADKGKLRQILLNLLGNAVKFTATGGVWMRASTAPLGTGGLRLVVLVGDSGPGIGAEEIGRLFAPFEQGEAGVRSCSGTGLGLAISRQLARLMGGDLTVSSEVGRGSVFRLEILAQPATDSVLDVMLEGAHVRPGQGEVDARAAEPDGTLVEQPQALIRERLDSLPAELRSQLREAAVRGRREQLRQTLQQVADPELRGQLLNLAAKFDYEPFL